MGDSSAPSRWTLYELPFAARLTLAAFLVSVGIGYFSALVQLHFQHARPGSALPNGDDAVNRFHPKPGPSRLERLVAAEENLSWNGSGQMSAAFFSRSASWPSNNVAKQAKVRPQREGERAAVLAWVGAEGDRESYEKDRFPRPTEVTAITPKYEGTDDKGPYVKLKSILTDRCVRCHTPGEDAEDQKARQYPLDSYEKLAKYLKKDGGGAMSLDKLAQTTHVHLLGFSMLYGLTGLLLALTSMPALVRIPLAPLPLIVQVVDISFWWLARLDAPYGPMFAQGIPITGMLVAAGLGLQIVLTLFSLFGRLGQAVLVVLMVATLGGGVGVYQRVVEPYLARERPATTATP